MRSRGSVSLEDRTETIEVLRAISNNFERAQFGRHAQENLYQLATQMLVEAKDTEQTTDADSRAEIENEIDRLFGDDPSLQRAQKLLVMSETQAGRSLLMAQRLERSRGIATALPAYRRVVERFPTTLAAVKAIQRLEDESVEADAEMHEATSQEQLEADFERLLQAQ